MEPKIKISRVITDFKPKRFFKYFTEECQMTKLLKLAPGEEAVFEIPGEREYTLSCVGEVPEKVIVEGNKIRIDMPTGDCIIFFKYQTTGKISMPEQATEVAINF